MITRRAFVRFLAGGLLAAPLAAESQSPAKVSRIGILSGYSPTSPEAARVWQGFRQGLQELGYVDICAFLQHLLRQLRGPVDLLWDRGSIHRRCEVRTFLAGHPRLHVHYFPAYAPELNPAEYVWTRADHELANGVPDDLRELRARLADATRRLRRSQALLWSCIYASDLPWPR